MSGEEDGSFVADSRARLKNEATLFNLFTCLSVFMLICESYRVYLALFHDDPFITNTLVCIENAMYVSRKVLVHHLSDDRRMKEWESVWYNVGFYQTDYVWINFASACTSFFVNVYFLSQWSCGTSPTGTIVSAPGVVRHSSMPKGLSLDGGSMNSALPLATSVLDNSKQ